MKSTYPDLDPHQVSVIDPITKRQLEITHYAATLGACIVSTIGLKIDFLERDIDAFAGWAGDLLQMGGVCKTHWILEDIIILRQKICKQS